MINTQDTDNEVARHLKEGIQSIAERDELLAALIKLRDCDFVITPHDRMDAVRDIARAAIAKVKGQGA